MLRNVQEVLADREFKVGHFYYHKGSMPSAVNRLSAVATQFPLYSQADEALWESADAYRRMGDRFENQQADAYAKIVRDYPLSAHVEEAKTRLQEMKRPVPEADPVAYNRMKYELDNRSKRSMLGKVWEPFSGKADTLNAAKSGTPAMAGFRPTIPASVPAAAANPAGVTDVSAGIAADASALDKNPDARAAAAQGANADGSAAAGSAPPMQQTKPDATTRQGVDLNTATEAEIAKLPGINKAMAKRIVLMRPYLSVNDLIRTGVSKRTIDKLKPSATEPAKTEPSKTKAEVSAKAAASQTK
jgi:outer membrane protein assembly factor BamD